MQASSEEPELTSSPSLSSGFPEEFSWKMKLHELDFEQTEISAPSKEEVEENDGNDEEEQEFTFGCISGQESPIAADDAFQNGQIKTFFPWFDQSRLLAGDSALGREDLSRRPPVRKVLIEAEDFSHTTVAEEEIGEVEDAKEHCVWSRKVVESTPEICKRSNSTGFSKIWRFREFTNRSNSDGRDAFVFLNTNSSTRSSKREEKVGKGVGSSVTKPVAGSEVKANSAGGKGKAKAKKGKKDEPSSLSAHELHYVTNRAVKDGNKRRSYLPYKPGVVGFFTSVNGGLSRNLHPY